MMWGATPRAVWRRPTPRRSTRCWANSSAASRHISRPASPTSMSSPQEDPSRAIAAQLASPSYRLAALDQDFLLGDSMRGVRFLLEFAKADEALRAWGVRSTVVVFGSARVRPEGPGRQAHWYAEARAFGALASKRGGAIRSV